MVHLPSKPVVGRAPEPPLASLFDALDDAISQGVGVLSRLLMDDDPVVMRREGDRHAPMVIGSRSTKLNQE